MTEKRHESNAARQKAYRERQKGEAPAVADDGRRPSSTETTPKPDSTPPSPIFSLDSYVEEALYMAELHHSQRNPHATDSTKTLAGALEQAEVYARWRYQAYLDGDVLTL